MVGFPQCGRRNCSVTPRTTGKIDVRLDTLSERLAHVLRPETCFGSSFGAAVVPSVSSMAAYKSLRIRHIRVNTDNDGGVSCRACDLFLINAAFIVAQACANEGWR